jgi:hypothetical protein
LLSLNLYILDFARFIDITSGELRPALCLHFEQEDDVKSKFKQLQGNLSLDQGETDPISLLQSSAKITSEPFHAPGASTKA